MAESLNVVGVAGLGFTAVLCLVACILGHWTGRNLVSNNEKWILVWLFYDLLTHFILEGCFVYISLTGTVDESNSTMALLCEYNVYLNHQTFYYWYFNYSRDGSMMLPMLFSLDWSERVCNIFTKGDTGGKEYGKADKRWLHSDPTVLSLEILTVMLGFLCIVLIYSICQDKFYRHFAQITLCVCELYGGWMTFCPEWLTGSNNLNTSDPMHHFVYLWFFNGLWVVIPVLLLVDSFMAMHENHQYRIGTSHKKRK